MKDKGPVSVEDACQLLRRSRLLSAEEVEALEQHWRREGDRSAGLERFGRWLTANHYLTEYQTTALLHGHADRFFLGPYKLLNRISTGGQATVYEAVHRLGERVALKVLPPCRTRELPLLARFQRAAQRLQRLQHPNLVRTLQGGDDSGLFYLVMEYLDGQTLQQVLDRRGRLPPLGAVEIVVQALHGLQYLHEQGLLHRNLEPAHLMLVHPASEERPDDGRAAPPTVKVLGPSLTLEESSPGGPDYLAPEQAAGAFTTDIRADIYSLGCILYHTLAGQPPFRDTNPLRQRVRHATEVPRPLHGLNGEVPEELEVIVGRMIAKGPTQRYPTPQQAAAALEAFLAKPSVPLVAAEAPEDNSGRMKAPTASAAGGTGPETASPEDETPFAFLSGPDNPSLEVTAAPGAPAPAFVEVDVIPLEAIREEHRAAPGRLPSPRRDFLLLLVGAAGLLVAQAIGWLLGRLSSHLADRDRSADFGK